MKTAQKRRLKKLSDRGLDALKPEAKPYKVSDEQGSSLFLLVNPNGSKLWRFRYHFGFNEQGKPKEKLLSLGEYPAVPLAKARTRRDEARALLADGIDPSDQRKEDRREQLAAAEGTFRAIAEKWLDKQKDVLAEETLSIHRGRLVSTLYPAFGSRLIDSIEPPELLTLLENIEKTGKVETAHRTRALFARVALFGIQTGRCKRNAGAQLHGALKPVQTTHFAAITEPRKVGELLRAIDTFTGQPSTQFALKVAPYLFVRPGELRHAEWQEVELDGDSPEWRIPAHKTKMKDIHVVPLAPQVVKILRTLKAITGDQRFLFPGLYGNDKPISDMTLGAALARLGYPSDVHTTHGFRSTASTLLNERSFAPDIIELQLQHKERNEVRSAYNYATKMPERRDMMNQWADYLDGLRAGGNVIGINTKRKAS